jgi:hypothetical protein
LALSIWKAFSASSTWPDHKALVSVCERDDTDPKLRRTFWDRPCDIIRVQSLDILFDESYVVLGEGLFETNKPPIIPFVVVDKRHSGETLL